MKKLILIMMVMVGIVVMAEEYGYETTCDQYNIPAFIEIHLGDNTVDEEIDSIMREYGKDRAYTRDNIEKGIIETYHIYAKVRKTNYAETQGELNAYTDFLIWMSMYANSSSKNRVDDRLTHYDTDEEFIAGVVGEVMNNHMRVNQHMERVYKLGKPQILDDLRHSYLDNGPLYADKDMWAKWTSGDEFYYNVRFIDIIKMRIYNILCREIPEK